MKGTECLDRTITPSIILLYLTNYPSNMLPYHFSNRSFEIDKKKLQYQPYSVLVHEDNTCIVVLLPTNHYQGDAKVTSDQPTFNLPCLSEPSKQTRGLISTYLFILMT